MHSKKFFLFNLVTVGIIIGFSLALVSFACTPNLTKSSVYAQDTGTDTDTVMSLEDMQLSFRQVANQVLPVVVEITTVDITKQTLPDTYGWPWDFFFGNQGQENEKEQQEREFRNEGLGSGVIVQKEGSKVYVLTNNHVVQGADEITVFLYDKNEEPYSAEIVGTDERRDLALIAFESDDPDIQVARLGDSDALQVGDWVLAIGNPYGYVSTVTAGIVSAKGRRGADENINDFIQTDAAINQGNSGGALVNLRGEVVGINTWIATPTGVNIGLGFAIPINNAKKAIDDFIRYGEVEYGWLGVTIGDPSVDLAKEMSLAGKKGAFIFNIYSGSPADKYGLLPGDYVLSLNGEKISDYMHLSRLVGNLSPGSKANFVVLRQKEELSLTVEIERRDDAETLANQYKNLWPGITVSPVTDEIRSRLELDAKQHGLVLSVSDNSKAQIAGMRTLDILTAINGTKVDNVLDFYRLINDKDSKKLTFSFLREGVELEIGILR